ncbi:MAG: hypothetical protein CBC42_03150 [Betaproteobacteria bacterium TMED82]|mgnify:CR=1 FL=1|nr:MAG: hypothetical protein CBC42_03150 [Betaproteobacteria bacterium TMED82]|tara:strand:+ start:20022 stop:21206 length:1185 start_codon:yes stop_codon:yes gene_type:complete
MKANISFLADEKKAIFSLASIYGLRMLGLFLIMPVVAIDLKASEGFENSIFAGLVIGAYGLTQAVFQIPFGIASDYFGRKPVIIFGLCIFAFGSFWAAYASTSTELLIARLVQGLGAISAAVTALVADVTREVVRTRAMAIIGLSIACSFIFSLVFSPILYGVFGLDGLFFLIGSLAILASFLVSRIKVPTKEIKLIHMDFKKTPVRQFNKQLTILVAGVFFLMFVQSAIFMIVPSLIVLHGFELSEHWKVYFPVILFAFICMIYPIKKSEETTRQKKSFLLSILFLIVAVALIKVSTASFLLLIISLFLYFLGFNLLEAFLPSWVSKLVPGKKKGFFLGVYNTSQALGIFTGGILGGYLYGKYGIHGIILACLLPLCLWLFISFKLKELSASE